MTADTERAFAVIKPMADVFGIKVSIHPERTILMCDNTAIGIGGNSTYATVLEFVGYVFLKVYMKDWSHRFTRKLTHNYVYEAVKSYWIEKERYDDWMEKFKGDESCEN